MNKKEIQIFKKCSKDIIKFLQYVIILTSKGNAPFKPYSFQARLLSRFARTWLNNPVSRHNHIVIGPRQCGKTTMIAAYILWFITFNSDKYVALLTNKTALSIEILKIIREMYNNLPDFLKVKTTRNNKSLMVFENGSRIFIGNPKADCVKGRAVDLLILDEAAFFPKKDFDNFLMSIFPTQASRAHAQMIMISTPAMINGFYKIWEHAKKGIISSFIPMKIKWDCLPDRTPEWKEKMIKDCGQEFFDREYAVKFV